MNNETKHVNMLVNILVQVPLNTPTDKMFVSLSRTEFLVDPSVGIPGTILLEYETIAVEEVEE